MYSNVFVPELRIHVFTEYSKCIRRRYTPTSPSGCLPLGPTRHGVVIQQNTRKIHHGYINACCIEVYSVIHAKYTADTETRAVFSVSHWPCAPFSRPISDGAARVIHVYLCVFACICAVSSDIGSWGQIHMYYNVLRCI